MLQLSRAQWGVQVYDWPRSPYRALRVMACGLARFGSSFLGLKSSDEFVIFGRELVELPLGLQLLLVLAHFFGVGRIDVLKHDVDLRLEVSMCGAVARARCLGQHGFAGMRWLRGCEFQLSLGPREGIARER